MATKLYATKLAHAALVSLFLTTSAMAQSSVQLMAPKVHVSIVNVASGNGNFVPAVQIVNPNGSTTLTRVGENGLTRAALYNKTDLTAWVLNGYPDEDNVQVVFDTEVSDDQQDDALPACLDDDLDCQEPAGPECFGNDCIILKPADNDCVGNSCLKPDCVGNSCVK